MGNAFLYGQTGGKASGSIEYITGYVTPTSSQIKVSGLNFQPKNFVIYVDGYSISKSSVNQYIGFIYLDDGQVSATTYIDQSGSSTSATSGAPFNFTLLMPLTFTDDGFYIDMAFPDSITLFTGKRWRYICW